MSSSCGWFADSGSSLLFSSECISMLKACRCFELNDLFMLKDNLVMLRRLHGFSQEEIAGKINISRQAYAKWESGATIPDIEKSRLLADLYGITIDGLGKTETTEGVGLIPPPPKGRNIWGSVTVNERGQIVIPRGTGEKYGLTGGQRLLVFGDEEGIALLPAEAFEEKMRKALEMLRNYS